MSPIRHRRLPVAVEHAEQIVLFLTRHSPTAF